MTNKIITLERLKEFKDLFYNNIITKVNENTKKINYFNSCFITPQMFGAKGDGVSDDTTAFEMMIKNNDKLIFIPNGVYIIKKPLLFKNTAYVKLSPNAELSFTPEENNYGYFICVQLMDNYKYYDSNKPNFITGGIITGGNNCDNLIELRGVQCSIGHEKTLLRDFNYSSIKCSAIDFEINGRRTTRKSQCNGSQLYIRNRLLKKGTVGIDDHEVSDCVWNNIEMRDIETPTYTSDGLFRNLHAWIGYAELYKNSTFAKTTTDARFFDCYMDTYRYGFEALKDSHYIVSNLRIYDNREIVSNQMLKDYPHILFKNMAHSTVICDGLIFNANEAFTFLDEMVIKKGTSFTNISIIKLKSFDIVNDVTNLKQDFDLRVLCENRIVGADNKRTINFEYDEEPYFWQSYFIFTNINIFILQCKGNGEPVLTPLNDTPLPTYTRENNKLTINFDKDTNICVISTGSNDFINHVKISF